MTMASSFGIERAKSTSLSAEIGAMEFLVLAAKYEYKLWKPRRCVFAMVLRQGRLGKIIPG